MKVKPEHYAEMKTAIAAKLETFGIENVRQYKEALKHNPKVRYPNMRFRWDLCNAAGLTPYLCAELYPYCHDDHIDTALRHIVAELGL
jgi:hypothetical protein